MIFQVPPNQFIGIEPSRYESGNMRYTSPLKVTVPSPYSLAQSCVTDTWGLPCGETARAMSVPSRPDTLRRAARVTGGWYAAGGGAEKIGGPGGNTDYL